MKGLSPGRRLALGAGIAALVAGILVAVFASGGGSAHRRPHAAGAGAASAGATSAPATTGQATTPAAKAGAAGAGQTKGRTKRGNVARARARARRGRAAHPGLLQIAAGYLGITVPQLRAEIASGHTLAQIVGGRPGRSAAGLVDALVAGRTAVIEAAVAEGRITKAVAARRLAQARRLLSTTVAHGRLGAPSVVVVALPRAAAYLGENVKKLRDQLRQGRTLAQIADATPGHSAAGLLDALVAVRKAGLDTLVKAGHLLQQREQALVAEYRARLAARIRQRAG